MEFRYICGMKQKRAISSAMMFVFLMGIVSLFADMTHESARSIYGAYLALAGASAATIGFVSGLGEFMGYSLRLVMGYVTDKRHNYWGMTIFGYVINLFAIPAIAVFSQNGWKWACVLIVFERLGKAIRQPAKNTMVSFASAQVGQGKAFAIQEFLDQIGAFSGPLLLFIVMLFRGNGNLFNTYRLCFALLVIPALITLFCLFRAKHKFPHPEQFEKVNEEHSKLSLNKNFWIYNIAISLFAFGFLDFPLITMHVSKLSIMPQTYLPLLYAVAMFVDAFAALLFGWMYDKYGMRVLMLSNLLAAGFVALIFMTHSVTGIVLGVILWGIGMGAQESILKSAVATLVPKQNRSMGFGLFETLFGVFWFIGSWVLGILYDYSIVVMVVVSVATQLLSIPLLATISGKKRI